MEARNIIGIFLIFTFHFSLFTSAQTDYVDPRIGSEGLGRVFIGPCLPFGMAKPGPDCGVGNNAGWAPIPAALSGFSQTHVSGTGGGPKYGNILVRPFSGKDQHRASEKIELGKYTCTFQESGIKAEVTSARRASFYRFTYPEGTKPHFEIDLSHFLGRNPIPKAREAQQFEEAHMDSTLQENGLYSYHGHQTISGGWNNGKPYTVYFWTLAQEGIDSLAHIEKPEKLEKLEKLENLENLEGLEKLETRENHQAQDNTLLLKVGISFVSEEQARINCEQDLPDWDFEAAHQRCLDEWQALLSRLPIQAEATDQVKRMYYTALYHMCLMPTDRNEASRNTVPPFEEAGEGVVRPYDDYYAIWDTYRTSTPLLTLLAPERATAIAQSLLTIYKQDGFLPDARSGNSNGRTQGGSNAEIVLCDALARGLDIDADLALEAMLKDATVAPEDDEAEGRGGLEEYNHLGYIPYIKTQPPHPPKGGENRREDKFKEGDNTSPHIVVSPQGGLGGLRIARAGNRTIEYAFCDWAIAQVAKMVWERKARQADVTVPPFREAEEGLLYDQYMKQSERWKNLWRADYEHDGARGFIMPRDNEGNWLDDLPFGHSQARPLTFRYTPDVSYEGPWYCKWWDCFMYEASSWEYSFSIPHDIPGLIEKCGGKDAFEARLDTFFAHGYYNVANEPSFLTPLLYHWIGKPEKSTALIRKIITENFSDRPDGLPGNDDGGAMSSWLACHLLGMYPLAGTNEWIKYPPINSLENLEHLEGLEQLEKPESLEQLENPGKLEQLEKLEHLENHAERAIHQEAPSTSDEQPYEYEVRFKLHGQTRVFHINRFFLKNKVRVDWKIKRNLKWWHGSFSVSKKALKKGANLCYEQPLDGLNHTLPDDETFLCLSTQAIKELQKKGTCTYDNCQWQVIDKTDTTFHLRSSEGAEMWVQKTTTAPLITKMINNPIEIDWEFAPILSDM